MAEAGSGPVLCPSSRCSDGALLLGVVRRDGTVAFTPTPLRIDAGFVEKAHQGRTPESRFRFAGPCQRARCQQWTGERCGVIDTVLDRVRESGVAPAVPPPDCAIRPRCRWFAQQGAEACLVCPLVVTEAG